LYSIKLSFRKMVHEDVDPEPRGFHLGRLDFLSALRNDSLHLFRLAEIGEGQEEPREQAFARIEQLIDQLRIDLDIT